MKLLTQDLREAGFTVVNEGHRTLWVPDQDALGACHEYGREFAREIK